MASITASNLTAGDSGGSAGTSFNTASITPTANNPVFFSILSDYSGTPGATSSVSGCNLTWTKVIDKQHPSTTVVWMTMFMGIGSSPSTGVLTITNPSNAFINWSVDQFSNTDTANIVVQSVSATGSGTQTGITATLSSLSSSNNAAYGFVGWGAGATITKGSNFTLLNARAGSFFGTQNSEWALNQTAVNWTWASASNWSIALAIEISIPLSGIIISDI